MSNRARKLPTSVHSPAQQAFRELMIEARTRSGMTQQVLAGRLGKPQSFVAKYEGGERRLDVTEFIGIVRVLGADPIKLLRELMKRSPK
jgi:transcriptional regulator with XRE-family HTH domain